MLRLKRIETKSDWREFIDLAWDIYGDDPNWVPPLKFTVRDLLDVDKHPFYRHAYRMPVIAYRDGKPVGRIVGIIDETHNRFHGESTAFFGFYESVDDVAVARALFDEVSRWAASRGMTTVRGPMNPSTNYECGLLVEGFGDPPTIMNTYNPPYYAKLFEACGFTKTKDLFAYDIDGTRARFSERLMAQAERLKQNASVSIRTVNLRKFDQEVELLHEIYNDAWEHNWGFVPMTGDEFRHLCEEMRILADPELILIAEVRGHPAGFGLALPDANLALRKVRSGSLLPFGWASLLWNIKGPGRKKTIDRARIVTLGIRREYQPHALGPMLYAEYLKRVPALGYPIGEASWILEDNKPMNRALELMCGKKTKTIAFTTAPSRDMIAG